MMCQAKVIAIVVLCGLICQPAFSLTFDAEAAKNRPVAKVVALLKDMIKQMEKEAEEDEEIYDKMACWCDSNDKEKTKSIADAEVRIEDLTTKIEELTALSAQLNTEIKNLDQEVAKNQNALDKATAMRQKDLAAFTAEEKDLLGTIQALKQAITVLSKHNSASLIQVDTSEAQIVAAKVQRVMQKHADVLRGAITHSERAKVTAFLQKAQNTAPSSEIFGIMNQMKETFETNLAESQKDEATGLTTYEELKAAKEAEIADGKEMIEKKTLELASTDEKNAQSKEDLDDTKNTLASDEEFLAKLKEQCSALDAEWEERQKTRQLEMEATSKALALLNSDEAHDLFSKTFSFLSVSNTEHSLRRNKVSQMLAAAAKKSKNPRLAALAYQVKLDSFTKVKKAMDDMIADLIAEKKAEIKHKDFCIEELNTNNLEIERTERRKADLTASIADLTSTIDALASAIDTLKTELKDAKTSLAHAGQDREAQNKEFATTVADQKAAQVLLGKAKEVLEGFYKKAASLAQEDQPGGFKKYKKNNSGVMGMIQGIIDDAKAMETEAIRNEEAAQKDYEDFVKETNASIEAKTKDMTNKIEEKGKTEAAKVQAETEMENTMLELEQLSNYNLELHKSCDFVLKNFDARQEARDAEVEAIKQAKAILSGAKFEAFLQQQH